MRSAERILLTSVPLKSVAMANLMGSIFRCPPNLSLDSALEWLRKLLYIMRVKLSNEVKLHSFGFLQSLLFFLVDVILRIPKTGLLTSLMCKIRPGFYLTIVHVLSYYLLYISLYSSIVISIIRVATVIIPVDAAKVKLLNG
ncbi:unnamed protein product [Cylicostephanus goldi]|uniref:Uncharacterized protein n=1 Tax=Cylicostephanus goldi TaxID=71465 RepID=A0A3P6R645_CYLGO|nr:unnamed protein product [Cylicostephanus goldi]